MAEEAAQEQIPPPPPPPEVATEAIAAAPGEAAISFSNGLAVKVSLIAALVGLLVTNVASVLPSPPLKMMGLVGSIAGAGFLAVLLYMRRSGHPMTVLAGARLGWITGVFLFVVLLVLITLMLVAPPENFADLMRQNGNTAEEIQLWTQMLQDPEKMSVMIVLMLLLLFTTCSMMASIGGALGAKWLEGPRG